MKQVILISCVVFGIMMLFMYFWQRHLIYLPAKERPVPENYQADDMQVISLLTEDGLRLNAWYKAALKNQPTVLYLHGNAGHIGYRMPLARPLITAGFGVFLLEYRGYGGNEGFPTEAGLYEDGRAAMRYLLQQGIKPSQIVLYGESLGTGVATQLAVESDVCAVVLQSPFTSLVDLARFHYPLILIKPWDRFDSLKRIDSINAALLVLHGTHDQIVPYAQALSLFKKAAEPKKMLHFEQHDHHTLWNSDAFIDEVVDFIRAHCS